MGKKPAKLPPIHPGEILHKEFMVPLGLSANQLGLHLQVPAGRISQIVNGQRAVTADTALRLSQYFGTTPEFWVGLQAQYELESAKDQVGDIISQQVRRRPAAKT